MVKKLLLLIIFVSGVFASGDLKISYEKYGGNNNIRLDFNTDAFYGANRDNWIGIYKQDMSNDWDNVIKWVWVRDLRESLFPGDTVSPTKRYINIYGLKKGAYELRFFKDNSYTTYDTYKFWIDGLDYHDITLTLNEKVFDYGDDYTLKMDATYLDSKTWVGIYRDGDSRNWENVIDWAWVKSDGSVPDIDLSHYSKGNYIVRLFFHNSYAVEDTNSFKVLNVHAKETVFSSLNGLQVTFNVLPANDSQKDWVGLFRDYNDLAHENLVAWNYVKNKNDSTHLNLLSYIRPHDIGDYKLVYFLNDSYTQFGKTFKHHFAGDIFDTQELYLGNSLVFIVPQKKQSKDWIGVFAEGKVHTSDNLLAWGYVSNANIANKYFGFLRLNVLHNYILKQGRYESVYFVNDSYMQQGKTGIVTVSQ